MLSHYTVRNSWVFRVFYAFRGFIAITLTSLIIRGILYTMVAEKVS